MSYRARLLRRISLAALVLNCGAAFGQIDSRSTANFIMPGCEEFAGDSNDTFVPRSMAKGLC